MSQRNPFLKIEQLSESDRFILFFEAQILVRNDEFLWRRQQLDDALLEAADLVFLEQKGESAIVAANVNEDVSASLQAVASPLRSLLFSSNQNEFSLAGRASQLVDWYNTHRFCGRCGKNTDQHEQERALICKECSLHYFPRINPCVIVLVVRGKQLLLARSSRFKSGFFSCLAGFIEIGETPEETVLREVKEEVNIDVEAIRYIKSQSWPFPSQLMLGYLADYKGGDIIPQASEIAEANWYDIDELPAIPSARVSVAGELIQYYIAQVRSGEIS